MDQGCSLVGIGPLVVSSIFVYFPHPPPVLAESACIFCRYWVVVSVCVFFFFFFVYFGSFHSLPLIAALSRVFPDLVGEVSLSLVTFGLRAVVFTYGQWFLPSGMFELLLYLY
jgi:hypothetical protein